MNDARTLAAALYESLGLPPTGLGTVEGAPVRVHVGVLRLRQRYQQEIQIDLQRGEVHHYRYDPRFLLTVDAELLFRPRLDLGLSIGAIAKYETLRVTGATDRVAIRGTELPRVAHIVTPAVRAALDRAFATDPGPTGTDGGLRASWHWSEPWPSIPEMVAPIRELATAWKGMMDACPSAAPPSGSEELMVALAGVAVPPTIELRGCPAGLVGHVDGRAFAATGRMQGAGAAGRAFLQLALGFSAPVLGSPQVVREEKFGWMDRITARLSGRAEITVGDRAFDRRFAIRSLRPELLRDVLTPAVREAMLALDARMPVRLSGEAITASGSVELRDLRRILDLGIGLCREL